MTPPLAASYPKILLYRLCGIVKKLCNNGACEKFLLFKFLKDGVSIDHHPSAIKYLYLPEHLQNLIWFRRYNVATVRTKVHAVLYQHLLIKTLWTGNFVGILLIEDYSPSTFTLGNPHHWCVSSWPIENRLRGTERCLLSFTTLHLGPCLSEPFIFKVAWHLNSATEI